MSGRFLRTALFAGATLFATAALLPQPASADHLWGAAAAGTYEYGSENRVSVGIATNYATASEAIDAAIATCEENVPFSCQLVDTFGVCGYITSGKGWDGNGVVGWGAGPTAQEAYNNCLDQEGMASCRDPIGGCND